MIITTLFALLLAIPLSSRFVLPIHFMRIVGIALLYAALLSYNSLPSGVMAGTDLSSSLFNGMLHTSLVTQWMEGFLFLSGAIILLGPWPACAPMGPAQGVSRSSTGGHGVVSEYALIALFSVAGSSVLLSSSDLLTLFLGIELQSFGVYVLASLYRDSETATGAGLQYFLLGALSSSLILLGAGLVYGATGLTNLDSLIDLMTVSASVGDSMMSTTLGLVLIVVGLLFKVAAAPFHFWAPDVYDGVPTLVTTWLNAMPKIGILVFLLGLHASLSGGILAQLLLGSVFLSLVIGTIAGLAQTKTKRLLAYSTISHVGFMLLALVVGTSQGMDAMLFYVLQYTVTTVNAFFVLLAFGYTMGNSTMSGAGTGLQYLKQLAGQRLMNPMLVISLCICLFSMAGIPPLAGFLAKYGVLVAAMQDHSYLAIIAILASVVSAAYYLQVVRILCFDAATTSVAYPDAVVDAQEGTTISSTLAYSISTLSMFIMLFAVNPMLILNGTSLMALSLH